MRCKQPWAKHHKYKAKEEEEEEEEETRGSGRGQYVAPSQPIWT